MPKLIIMCGAPGSGKSTWAENYRKAHVGTLLISRDKIRFEMLGEKDNYFSKENAVYNQFCREIKAALRSEYNVIADASHLTKKSRMELLRNIGPFYDELWVVVFKPPLETCYERNDKREGRAKVPHHAIQRMYYSMTDPKDDGIVYTRIIYPEAGDVV